MIPENVFFTHMWYNNHMLMKKNGKQPVPGICLET